MPANVKAWHACHSVNVQLYGMPVDVKPMGVMTMDVKSAWYGMPMDVMPVAVKSFMNVKPTCGMTVDVWYASECEVYSLWHVILYAHKIYEAYGIHTLGTVAYAYG